MAKEKKINQGDIYICNLSKGSVDHEQSGVRPCLIISANIRNDTSDNVFIFPITHANKKSQPCHYILLKENYDFFAYSKNIVLCEEGRSISKKRLERFVGSITLEDLTQILECKEYVFIEK